MNIYIAAPWAEKTGLAKTALEAFTAAGHTVISSWIMREVGDPPYSDALMRSEAADDYVEVTELADVLVLINSQKRGEETSGKAVETGLALASGIPIILVGERTNVFHWLSDVQQVATIADAIEVLSDVLI